MRYARYLQDTCQIPVDIHCARYITILVEIHDIPSEIRCTTWQVWDGWGKQMDSFWNVNCVPPWHNWSIGEFGTMLFTPSQNCQESWHKQILLSKIPNMFKGSTAHVIQVALPQLIQMDNILIPSTLNFKVYRFVSRTVFCVSCNVSCGISRSISMYFASYLLPNALQVPLPNQTTLERASWYIDNKDTHVWRYDFEGEDQPDGCYYIFLSKDNPLEAKRLTKKLVEMYFKAFRGTRYDRDCQIRSEIHLRYVSSLAPQGSEIIVCKT